MCFHHLERVDDIAQRFGHLVALFIQHEAVGEDVLIGRFALGAAGFEQGISPNPNAAEA